MMTNYINPTFNIGNLTIAWYGVCILIGIILAVLAGVKEGKKIGIYPDDIYLGVIIVVPCAIVGARLWYVLFNLDKGWTLSKILGLEGGLAGLAIQGGVIAALIAIVIYCKVKKLSLYRILDLVAPGFLIGQICGRYGNFCNHELYGPIVKNPEFLKSIPILGENMYINGAYRHPTFLYESSLNLVGLIIMLVLRRKFKKLKSGDLIGFYLVWYGCVRIFTETLRSQSGANEVLMAGGISVSILISIIFIVVGIAFLILKRFIGPKYNYQEILEYVKSNKPDLVLFDLDGTLLDTKPLIDASFIHVFEKFRPDYNLTEDELDAFFGPTLYQSFSKYSNDENEIEKMIAYYREYNIKEHDSVVKAFPQAKEVIDTLNKKGIKLGVVSSKKTDLVCHGLELFGLLEKMDLVIGSDEVINHKPAPDGILLAKERLHGNVVYYVGDTKNDIIAAKAANVKSVGVLYSKHPEVMLEVEPDYTINKLNDLLRIFNL